MKYIEIILFFLSFSFLSPNIETARNKLFRLHIIHYNDFHARFEETSNDALVCGPDDASCFGGLPRMVYEIEALQRQNPGSVLLEAGDSFQGTYWYTELKWNVTQYFLNLLDHDAHAIGNHEFDDDIKGLVPFLASLKAPVVAANLDSTYEPSLQGLYKPYVIVERNGRKIGIIGVTTTVTEVLAPTGRIIFKDPREAAYYQSKQLNDMGINIIILLSHCGYPMDVEIARDYGRYIDVIVGGHSHRDKTETFPYQTRVATSNTNHEVLVLQADAFSRVLGNLSVYFNNQGDAVLWEGGEILLDKSIPQDENVIKQLEPYARMVHAAAMKPIGYITTAMSYKDCLYGECLMGNFLTDVIKYYAKSIVESPYQFIALIQRSNMRAVIPAGVMTEGEVVELFPYFDPVESFQLQGKYVIEALERSVSDLMKSDTFMAPWLLQVSGLNVVYNISKSEGSRVESVFFVDTNYNKKVPLEPDTIYQIVSTSYLAFGGDGYTVMDHKMHMRSLDFDQFALRQYIKQFSPIHVYLEQRIVIHS